MKKVKGGFFIPSRDMNWLAWILDQWIPVQDPVLKNTAAVVTAKRIRAEYKELKYPAKGVS